MNRLWVRLSLAFALVVLLGPLLLASIGLLVTNSGTLMFFIRMELTSPGSLTEQLSNYYAANQGWEGVETLLQSYDLSLPRGPEGRSFSLSLLNEGGVLVYKSAGSDSAQADDMEVNRVAIPLVVGERLRGTLVISQERALSSFLPNADSQAFLLRQISTALVGLAVISAVLGLSGGVILSRSLAAPLARLEHTARRFGRRDFKARAEVKGSTELRAVASAFNEMAADLERTETLRRNLLADVAHELRTPLSVLQGNLQALLDGVFPLEKDEIARLMSQTDMLTRLVNDLRELAQAEAHQLRLTKSEIDLALLVRNTVDTFRHAAAERGVRLSVETPDSALLIQAEAGRIQQVMSNLIDNALKHTPGEGQVTIALLDESDSAVLTVSDTGEGILPEHLPHVFDRFYRADRSRSRDTGGSGLGLAIAKAFVELHDGTISVESAGVVGQGSKFIVKLPQKIVNRKQS